MLFSGADYRVMSRVAQDKKSIALVALKESVVLEPERLVFALRSLFPDLQKTQIDVADSPDQASGITMMIGQQLAAVLHFGFPIPPDTLEWPIGNEIMWKAAQQAFAGSQAHLLVSAIGNEEQFEQRRKSSWTVSQLVAALVSLYPIAGVLWTPSEVVIEPQRFMKEAVAAKESQWPVDLWFGLEWYKGKSYEKDHAIVCRTRGIGYFSSREIECGPVALAPSELGQLVQGLGRYVLLSGRKFQDGDTVELREGSGKSAKISYEASSYGGLAPVMKVVL
jgi:Domain of unknown function (DUF4261)